MCVIRAKCIQDHNHVLSLSLSSLSLSSLSLAMKSSRRARFSSAYSSTVTYTFQNDFSTPKPEAKATEIPIESDSPPVPITVHLPHRQSTESSSSAAAAAKIQAAYRSYRIRFLVKKISAVNSEASRLERLIQRQETVDAVRGDPKERIKMNEALMRLLLTLDSVPGVDETVRELRRRVSRRIVGLQEILDAITEAKVEEWNGFMRNWDEVVENMEEEMCRERGGREMERFCAEYLGFRCLQRFLRDQ